MKKIETFFVFVVFILLTITNSGFCIKEGYSSYVECVCYGILITLILYFFIRKDRITKDKIICFFSLLFLFSIGILLQNIIFVTKIKLIVTMLILEIIMMFSETFLDNFSYIRASSYGIIIGILFTSVIALITNTSIIELNHDATVLKYGFNGGFQYKNYFAGALLCSYIGLMLYIKNVHKSCIDIFFMVLITLLLIISNSRGGLLLYLIYNALYYCIIENKKIHDLFSGLNKKQIIIIKIAFYITSLLLLICAFMFVLPRSSTYSYRIRGVNNYLELHKNDYFHLLFGNARIAYGFSEYSYVESIKRFLTINGINGYSGSYEMGFINVLIKNGIVGIYGYILAYVLIIQKTYTINSKMKKNIYILLVVLIISSLVESYVCNLHNILGVYFYLVMNGLISIGKREEFKEDKYIYDKYNNVSI